MTGTTQAQAEEKPATAAPTPEADTATQPTPEGVSLADIQGANLDDLDALQTQAAKITAARPADSEVITEEPPKPTEEAPKPPTEEAPAPEPAPEPEKPQAEPVAAQVEEPKEEPKPEPEPEEPRGELPERFRFKNPTDRAIAAVYKAAEVNGTPITWAEAERRVRGEVTEQRPSVDPIADVSNSIETLKAEIAELEKKIDPEDEDEILSTKDMRKAQVELARKTGQLTRAELEFEAIQRGIEVERQGAIAHQQDAREQSKNRAIAEFPDAADANTKLGKAIAQRFEEMKNPRHPDHPILYADSAPERVTEIVAKELGIAPKPKAPVKPTAPPAPQQVKATPVSGAKTSVPEKPAEATKDKRSVEYLQSEEATLEDLDAAFGADQGLAAAVR